MATVLSFMSGRQITDDDGNPVDGAKMYHYEAGTTNDLTVYTTQAGSPSFVHTQPVVCDAGFVPLVYISDASDWKIVVTDADDVVLSQYGFDNLPKAQTEESALGFAPPLFEFEQKTNADSPVGLTAADAGGAYEADTTSGNVEFDLPSAASVGNGKGFVFKKLVAANSMVIDQSGAETIDDSATALTITTQYQVVAIVSNGAEWYVAWQYLENVTNDRLSFADQADLEAASDNELITPPGQLHHHPGIAKFWAFASGGGSPSLEASYNVTGITDLGAGNLRVTIATDFGSADWCCLLTVQHNGSASAVASSIDDSALSAGVVDLFSYDTGASAAGNLGDPNSWHVAGFGDQA